MLIALEGVDRTGKSTLAQAIADQIGAELRHYSKPELHPLDEYEVSLDDYVPASTRHVVCDRFHWGELVWPGVYQRMTQYDRFMALHTEMFLRSRGAIMIHARANEDEIIARADGPYPPADQVKPALVKFNIINGESLLPRFTYDFARGLPGRDVGDAAELAVTLAQIAERQVAYPMMVTDHWIGSPRPAALLVGDTPSDAYGPNGLAVPFRPYSGSAHYLMEALTGVGNVDQLAITNVTDGYGTPVHLGMLWEQLGRPHVVALGWSAATAIAVAGIPEDDVRQVVHPQWARRFKYHHMNEYRAMLRQAIAGQEVDQWT